MQSIVILSPISVLFFVQVQHGPRGICWAEKAACWLIPRGAMMYLHNELNHHVILSPIIILFFVQVQHCPSGISQQAAFSAQQIPASTAHLHHAVGIQDELETNCMV